MAIDAREYVPALAGLLTVAALALVFGAALGAVPRAAIPRAPGGSSRPSRPSTPPSRWPPSA